MMALSKLPGEEHLGFYGSGPSVPTAIVRTMLPPREAKAAGIKPGETLTVVKDGKDWYYLCRPDGRKLSRIRADAKVYLGMTLKVVGFLPDSQAPSATWSRCPSQHEGPSYTLALKLLTAWQPTADNGRGQRRAPLNRQTGSEQSTSQLPSPRGRKASARQTS